ncbi:MAG: DivIVA domain-containing protein [Armatimonadota bacterium]
MAIKPIDIQNTSFSSKLRGYDKEEVDEFLRQVVESFNESLELNVRLNEKLSMLESEVIRFKEIENSLNSVLILAQKAADDLRTNAKTEADLIVREAKASASVEVEQARIEFEDLKKTKLRFETEMRALLRTYLEICEDKSSG